MRRPIMPPLHCSNSELGQLERMVVILKVESLNLTLGMFLPPPPNTFFLVGGGGAAIILLNIRVSVFGIGVM